MNKTKLATPTSAQPAKELHEIKQPKVDIADDYDVKDHLGTIVKAHSIINDPVKMKKVHKLLGRHKKAISSLQDLRDLKNSKYGGVGGKPQDLESEPDADDSGTGA